MKLKPRVNVRVANNHLDFDITGEKSLRGPFGETHIGGMPHNKVRFGTQRRENGCESPSKFTV